MRLVAALTAVFVLGLAGTLGTRADSGARLTERVGEAVGVVPGGFESHLSAENEVLPQGRLVEAVTSTTPPRSVSRALTHFGHPQTWFTRHAPDYNGGHDGTSEGQASGFALGAGSSGYDAGADGSRAARDEGRVRGVPQVQRGVQPRLTRQLAHYGHPQTWFTRHASDADKARILRSRIKHADDVARFFRSHPKLANTKAGRSARWQHGRMGRWARRELARVLWSPPLLVGEREWHASMKNVVNRNLLRLARCETGYLSGGRVNWAHSNSQYAGGLGFALGTWAQFRHEVRPLPPRHAYEASAAQQLAVGRALVRRFGGYSSWPSCHRRLGIY